MDVVTAAAAYYFHCANYQYMLSIRENKVIKRTWSKRRWWMKTIHKKRSKESMEKIIHEMLAEPSNDFHNFCRMSFTDFEFLLQKLGPLISKKDTHWRDSIPSKVRLAVTLRFLASGARYRCLQSYFNISSQIISKIIQEVCIAIYQVLKDNIMIPSTGQEWLDIEHSFCNRFPHAVGAIDEKHVVLKSTKFQKSLSFVLMALLDSNYCFLFADVECQGRISDGDVFKNTCLWNRLENNLLRLPAPTPLPNGNIDMPYVFLGDGAFALHSNLMTPYPGEHEEGTKERIFNKKLSSARVIVENTFGVMTSVFRVLRQPLLLEPEAAKPVVMACIVLHNFLRRSQNSTASYNPPGTFDVFNGDTLVSPGSWRNDIPNNPALRNPTNMPRSSPKNAVEIRNVFANYLHTSQII